MFWVVAFAVVAAIVVSLGFRGRSAGQAVAGGVDLVRLRTIDDIHTPPDILEHEYQGWD